jgi:2'-hydroxyisoflavone reductase
MSATRREFLRTSSAFAAFALLPRAFAQEKGDAATQPSTRPKSAPGKGKTILILGGTSFLGPQVVEAAQKRGHTLTLFNRGKTNPQLFPDIEKLHGDRDGQLDALKGRKWDAVVDTSGYVPRVVRMSAELLKDAVQQYIFISSISVYSDNSKPGMDESGPIAKLTDETNEDFRGEPYGALKALCEVAVEQTLPGRTTNIRPGLIVGPGDPSDRFTYWPVRVARGGEVLAPGTPKDPVQFIDVRDLGEWIVTCIEHGTMGVFNATGPKAECKMGELLEACKKAGGSDAKFAWAGAEFLEQQKVSPWQDMPVWVPPIGDSAGFSRVSAAKAIAKGLTFRPLADTVKATLEWFRTLPEERQKMLRAGITPEREQEVLKALHDQKK